MEGYRQIHVPERRGVRYYQNLPTLIAQRALVRGRIRVMDNSIEQGPVRRHRRSSTQEPGTHESADGAPVSGVTDADSETDKTEEASPDEAAQASEESQEK